MNVSELVVTPITLLFSLGTLKTFAPHINVQFPGGRYLAKHLFQNHLADLRFKAFRRTLPVTGTDGFPMFDNMLLRGR